MCPKTNWTNKVIILDKKYGWIPPIVALGLLLACNNASAVMIDVFESETILLMVDTLDTENGGATMDGDPLRLIGGERDIYVKQISSHAIDRGRLQVNQPHPINDGESTEYLAYSLTNEATGYVRVIWDGVEDVQQEDSEYLDVDFTGLGGIDLTGGGEADTVYVDVLYDDVPVNVYFTIYSDEDHFSQGSITLPGGLFGGSATATRFELPFSALQDGIGSDGGADFENVGAIVFEIDATFWRRADVTIDEIGTYSVPEPGGFGLLGIGLACCVTMRQHRRRRV